MGRQSPTSWDWPKNGIDTEDKKSQQCLRAIDCPPLCMCLSTPLHFANCQEWTRSLLQR
jgi:hypothetical protein